MCVQSISLSLSLPLSAFALEQMMNMKRVKKRLPLYYITCGASVCGGYREPLLLSVNELKQTHPSDTQIESDGRVGVEEKVFPSIVFFRFFSSYLLFLILFFVLFFPLTGAVCGTKQVRS
jgi:hypothetical protein